MTVVGLTGQLIPGDEVIDEQWSELTGRQEMARKLIDVLTKGSG